VTPDDETAGIDLSTPPRGVNVAHSLISGIDLTHRRFNPAVLALIPFTAVWSGFSLWGIYGSQIASGKFDAAASLAGLPFVLGTVVLFSVIAHMLFGRWHVHIDRGTVRIFSGVGPIGRRREMTLGPGAQVRFGPSRLHRRGRTAQDIILEHEGRRVNFGATLPDDVRLFFAAVLRQAVRTG
jgi:hypothetical protein